MAGIAGAAIGLDGARQIVAQHGGAMTVESVEGEGSVFAAGVAVGGREVTSETLWAVGSITKLYTAAAVVALIERGLLTLSTPCMPSCRHSRAGGASA